MAVSATKRQEFVTAASASPNRLEYLTANDWALLLDTATLKTFNQGEEVIPIGVRQRSILFLSKGSVRVVSGGNWQIARVGAGEILGEMAFLEGNESSATVVAEEPCEAYVISWNDLVETFEAYPHLAARFYRSVAVSLSRRLRGQISE